MPRSEETTVALIEQKLDTLAVSFQALQTSIMDRVSSLELSRVEVKTSLASIETTVDRIAESLKTRLDGADVKWEALRKDVDMLKQWRTAGIAIFGIACGSVGWVVSQIMPKVVH